MNTFLFCKSSTLLKLLLLLFIYWSISLGNAHATVVLGTINTQPSIISVGEPFSLNIDLVDPSQVPVEDAWVIAEFRPEGAPDSSEPISIRLEESQQKGSYKAEVTLSEEGNWQLFLRDQTFRQEEATASLSFPIQANTTFDPIKFIFPPTDTGSNNIRTWIIWIIGLPVAAGIITTIIVLRNSKKDDVDEIEA